MLAAKVNRGWIFLHHLGDVRVEAPGVCTQSVMSTVVIRSNLMGCQRTDEVMSTRRQKISGQNSEAINILNARGILARTRCRQCQHGVPCPFGSFLSDRKRQPDFEDRKRARQKPPSLMTENGNACTTCTYLSPTPDFFVPFYYSQCLCPYGQRCSDTNDALFERRVVSVYNAYLHILCMIEPVIGIRFSSSVKHLYNMHLSRRLHRSTSDGLLMVAQKKGVSNIHCILVRFIHI